MTFREGLAIAEKYGLEEEYEECYDALAYDAWYNNLTEDDVVRAALREWDLL